MELTWLDRDNLDDRDVAGAVAVIEAARLVDTPHQLLSMSVSWFTSLLRHGWDGDPPVTAVTRDAAGRVVGVLQVWLPHWDNTHLGSIEVTVDPPARRQGLGRRLFDAGVERIRAEGRTLVLSSCFDGSAGVEFLKAMGLDRAYEEVYRRQDLRAVDWARLDQEYQAAQAKAAAYELIRMPGATPEDMMADVVRMTTAINDAPTDDLQIEDEVFTPQRLRAFEAAQLHRRRVYRLTARARDTGELAGHTMIAVEIESPWQGWQFDTSVLRAHRGHRLGLLLKIGMMRWLREAEPQLNLVDTGNAASNAHMIAVNELLGYHVIAKAIEWQRPLT